LAFWLCGATSSLTIMHTCVCAAERDHDQGQDGKQCRPAP
jgi:hypothetical protein